MPEYIIQIDKDDYQKIEEEEKNKFIKNILSEIGISFEEIWLTDDLSVSQKIKLRKLLDKYDLDILDQAGSVLIYHERVLIARLNKPRYILRKDHKAIKQSQKEYFEVIYEYWTAFDDLKENDE